MSTFSLYPEFLLLSAPLHLTLHPFLTPRTQTGEEPLFGFFTCFHPCRLADELETGFV